MNRSCIQRKERGSHYAYGERFGDGINICGIIKAMVWLEEQNILEVDEQHVSML